MALIRLTSQNFPNGLSHKKSGLITIRPRSFVDITREDIVHGALTLGLSGLFSPILVRALEDHTDVLKQIFGYSAVADMYMIKSILQQHSDQFFTKSTEFEELDPEQKTPRSSILGKALGKVIFEYHYGSCPVLYLDQFRSSNDVDFVDGKKRPDLVAIVDSQNSNVRYFVIECKARSNGFDNSALVDALEQSKNIGQICNKAPDGRIAAQAYFAANSPSALEFIWKDPDGNDDENDVVLPRNYHFFHYAACLGIINSTMAKSELSGAVEKIYYEVSRVFRDLDLTIELHPEVETLLDKRDWSGAFEFCKGSPGELTRTLDEGYYPDGIRIRLGRSWNLANNPRAPSDPDESSNVRAATEWDPQAGPGDEVSLADEIISNLSDFLHNVELTHLTLVWIRHPEYLRWAGSKGWSPIFVVDAINGETKNKVIMWLEKKGFSKKNVTKASDGWLAHSTGNGRFLCIFDNL